MKLNPPETAPKTHYFIGTMRGYPWPTLCAWSPRINKWVWCNFQSDLAPAESRDTYFENEWDAETELTGWLPLEGFTL